MITTRPVFIKISLFSSILAMAACAELGGENTNYFAPVTYEKNSNLEATDNRQTPTKSTRLEASDKDSNATSSGSSASGASSAPSKAQPIKVAVTTQPVKAAPVPSNGYSGGAGGGGGNSQLSVGDIKPKPGGSIPAGTPNNVAVTAVKVVKNVASTTTAATNKAVSAVKNIKIKNPFK